MNAAAKRSTRLMLTSDQSPLFIRRRCRVYVRVYILAAALWWLRTDASGDNELEICDSTVDRCDLITNGCRT